MPLNVVHVIYVKDGGEATAASQAISEAHPCNPATNLHQLGRLIFVDVKGRSLGNSGGSTDLVTVLVPSRLTAYVFDVKELQMGHIVALRQIFADSSLTKCFFDCRRDIAALKSLLTSDPVDARLSQHEDAPQFVSIIDTSAAVMTAMLLDDGLSPTYMKGLERAFEEYGFDARLKFEVVTARQPSNIASTLEMCLFEFRSQMSGRMNTDRDLWTKRPLLSAAVMYSTVAPLMSLLVLSNLRKDWLEEGEAHLSHYSLTAWTL
eukprot:4713960-Prymnesium_polylepis.1